MWFDDWYGISRVILVGVAAYVTLVVAVRVAGKRALAQLNAFDLVVTVALGSTLATILLTSDVAYLEGVVAFAVLLLLQVVVAFAVKRVPPLRRVVTARPALLARDGSLDENALRRHRVTRDDVFQAVRSSGTGDLARVGAVVLESNGQLSVIPRSDLGDGSLIADLR